MILKLEFLTLSRVDFKIIASSVEKFGCNKQFLLHIYIDCKRYQRILIYGYIWDKFDRWTKPKEVTATISSIIYSFGKWRS